MHLSWPTFPENSYRFQCLRILRGFDKIHTCDADLWCILMTSSFYSVIVSGLYMFMVSPSFDLGLLLGLYHSSCLVSMEENIF